jgi:uncharacterized protein
MKWKQLFAAATLALSAGALAADYQVGDHLKPPAAATEAGYRTITWDDLVPADWHPEDIFKQMDFANLKDNDPRAGEALQKMRDAWDKAPVVPAMSGQQVRIPGFLVKLEGDAQTVREFLLVPYFGACIHVPPPPANQVIHVVPEKPVPAALAKDSGAVWVSGVLSTTATVSDLGNASYKMKAVKVEVYKQP